VGNVGTVWIGRKPTALVRLWVVAADEDHSLAHQERKRDEHPHREPAAAAWLNGKRKKTS
jgi:hypothetical protein